MFCTIFFKLPTKIRIILQCHLNIIIHKFKKKNNRNVDISINFKKKTFPTRHLHLKELFREEDKQCRKKLTAQSVSIGCTALEHA